jgi:hypothetical protein
MTRVSDNFFKLTTDIGDGYILRRDGDIVGGVSTQELSAISSIYYEANWSVIDWYLDSVNGSDTNDGLTEDTAIQTVEELSRRLALPLTINHDIRVWFAQGSYGSLYLQASLSVATNKISFTGTAVIDLETTIESYTIYSHVTRSATHVSLTGVSDLTAYIGRRIRRVSDNSVSFIGAVNHDSLGVSVASIAPPYSITTGLTVVWSVADAVVIEMLPSLAIVQGQIFPSRKSEQCLRFESLNITSSYSVEIAGYQGSNGIVGCSITGFCQGHFPAGSLASNVSAIGCFYDPFPNNSIDCGIYFYNSVIRASSIAPVACRGMSRSIVLRSGFTPSATIPANISDSQFFDSTRVAVEPPQGSIITLSTGFSCSNVYCAFRIGYNTRIKCLSTIVVGIAYTDTGSVILRQNDGSRTAPFYLSGTSEQVWAALTNYQDGQQRGQAQISSDGYTDIICTNPTDFTLQQVRVSCPSSTTIQPYAPLGNRLSYVPHPMLSLGSFRIYGEVGKIIEWEITKTEHNIYFSNY